MRNVFTIIKKEFSRFFKDKRMIIAVLMPGLLIYALYSILGAVITDKTTADEGYKYTAYVENMPQNEKLREALYIVLDIDDKIEAEEAQQKVEDGSLNLAIIFPSDFDSALNGSADSVPD